MLEASHVAEALGARVDMIAGVVESTAERLGRVRGALDCIIAGHPVSGQELENVLGSVTFIFLLRRACLAALDLIYDYIRCDYLIRKRVPLEIVSELSVVVVCLRCVVQS